MISTGINGIDEMLGGGIPDGSRVLYSMEPGVDGQLFMISAFLCALAQRLPCLVILPNTTVDAFLHDAAAMRGSKIELSPDTVVFMDAVDRERIQRACKSSGMKEQEWQARIQKICREKRIEIIFAYFDLLYEDCGLGAGLKLIESARTGNTPTIILEHLNLEGKPLVERFIHEFLYDLVITIRSSFPPIPQFSFFTIVHTSWSPVMARSVPFIISDGKIIPYIPRIVITGPAGAGKSTFVSNASDEGHSIDRKGINGDSTTVAMDFGYLRWKDFDITLYGTPGHARFDPLLPPVLNHAMGVVIIIDATKPDSLPRAKDLIALVAKKRVPMVIAANKMDLPDTMNEQKIKSSLGLADEIPLFFISASKRNDVHRVLESMVDHITQFSY
jgi:uncharacterized protein